MTRRPRPTLAALALAALMATAAPSWAQVDLRDPFDVRMQEGTAAYALQDYEAAARHFGDARLLRPDSPEAAMNQGLAEARQGRYDEALETLDDAAALGRDLSQFAPLPRFNEGVANLRRAEGLLDPESPTPPKTEDRNQAIESLLGAIDAFGDVQAGGALGDAARVGRQLAQGRLAELTRPQPTPPPSDQQQQQDDQQQQQDDQQQQQDDQQQQDQQDQQDQQQQQQDQQQQQNQQSSSDQQQPGEQRSSSQPQDESKEQDDRPSESGQPQPTPTPGPGMEANAPPDFNKPRPTPTPSPDKPGDKQQPGEPNEQESDSTPEGKGANAQPGEAKEGEGEGEPATPVTLSPQEAERLLNMVDDKMLMFRQGQQTANRSGKDW